MSRKAKLGVAAVLSALGALAFANALRGDDADAQIVYILGLAVCAAVPAVVWVLTRGDNIGGGDIELYADALHVPRVDDEPITLPLEQLEVTVGTETFGVGIGPAHYSLESGTPTSVQLRSAGATVRLRRDLLKDEDHLRQLIEHLTVVNAGGEPDGSAAFLARGFD